MKQKMHVSNIFKQLSHRAQSAVVSSSSSRMAEFIPSRSSWEWKTQLYMEQEGKEWPSEGRHVLAQYDDQGVVVYQAYCPEIAKYATDNQRYC